MQGARPAVRLMLIRCSRLLLWALGLWGVLLYPAYAVGGRDGLEGLTLAAVLCLLPGWLVLLAASRWDQPTHAPLLAIGSSVLRMLFVLGGMLVVQQVRIDLQFHEFVLWLLVFYLGMLAVETRLLLRKAAEGAAAELSGMGESDALKQSKT